MAKRRLKIQSFHNAETARWVGFVFVLGFDLLIATRMWYMVDAYSGFLELLWLQAIIAVVVALSIAGLAMFGSMHGGYSIKDADDYDRANGRWTSRNNNKFNIPPTRFRVYGLNLLVLLMEWTAIYVTAPQGRYRMGYMVFFAFASIIPYIIGAILFASVNKPIASYKAERARKADMADLVKQEIREEQDLEKLLPPKQSRGPWFRRSEVQVMPEDNRTFQRALPQGPSGQGQQHSSGPNQQQRPNSYPQGRPQEERAFNMGMNGQDMDPIRDPRR